MYKSIKILNSDFFNKDCLEIAPALIGKILVRKLDNGNEIRIRITETEAYRGMEDKACHASKGKTPRASILWCESGIIYVYLCYGVHWLFNIVTGNIDEPQAVLIRAGENAKGPGILTKKLGINKDFNEKNITSCHNLWLEDDGYSPKIKTDKRVGIDYAGDEWVNKPWRFIDAEKG